MAERIRFELTAADKTKRAFGGVNRGLAKMRRNAQKLSGTFRSVGRNMSLFVTAPITALTAATAQLADTQIQAERSLSSALAFSGGAVEQRLAGFKAFASELQGLTAIGDEVTLQNVQVAKSMGLTDTQAKRAAKNAIAMSAAFRVNAKAAIRYTASLEEGDTTMLNRYIPTLKGLKNQTERVAEAQNILAGSFDIAIEAAKTGLGPFRLMVGELNDLGEKFGVVVLPAVTAFSNKMREVIKTISDLTPVQKKWILGLTTAVAVGGPLIVGLGILAAAIGALITPIGGVLAVLATASGLVAYFGLAGKAAQGFSAQIKTNETNIRNATGATREYRAELAALIRVQEIEAASAAEVLGVQLDNIQDAVGRFEAFQGPKLPFQTENIKIVGVEMEKVFVKYTAAVAVAQKFRKQINALKDIQTPIAPGVGGSGGGAAGAVEALTASLTPLQERMNSVSQSMSGAFTGFFTDVAQGTNTVADAFKNMAKRVVNSLFEILVVKRLVGGFDTATGTGTGIVGAILGGFRSFDGGGSTGTGPRTGGLDGKGGFMAMMHPNETVIDHTKGQSTGGTSVIQVVLSPDLEASILQKAVNQAIQIVGAGMAAQDRNTGNTLQNFTARQG